MGFGEALAGAGAGAAAGAAGGPWGALIGAGIGLFGNLFGAHMQTKANEESAKVVADAQKYAADLQARGTAEALSFTKGQAQNAFLNTEAARQGNYGMYAAAQRRLGSVGSLIGAPAREIPAYVPGVDPHFDGGSGNVAAPSGDPKAAAFIANWQSRNAPNKMALLTALQQAGFNASEYKYGAVSSGNEITLNGQKYKVLSNENSANPQHYVAGMNDAAPGAPQPLGSVASYLNPIQPRQTPYAVVPVARGLTMPGSAASYLNG